MNRYEFAMLRYVHDPVGGEFANVGIALLDIDARRLRFATTDRYGRFSDFFKGLDGGAYRSMLRSVERSLGDVDRRLEQGDIERPVPERLAEILEQILPPDGSAIQVSAIMGGIHEAPDRRLSELFHEFIGRYDSTIDRAKRDERQVWRDFSDRMVQSGLDRRVQYDYAINAPHYRYQFYSSWQNGRPQVLEPISFDLERGSSIVEKAIDWSGRLHNLAKGGVDFRFTGLVAPPQDKTLLRQFRDALSILEDSPNVRRIVPEGDSIEVLQIIRDDTEPHAATKG